LCASGSANNSVGDGCAGESCGGLNVDVASAVCDGGVSSDVRNPGGENVAGCGSVGG
jgi:hypothetical protein